jgi:hypothetical protein
LLFNSCFPVSFSSFLIFFKLQKKYMLIMKNCDYIEQNVMVTLVCAKLYPPKNLYVKA